MENTVTEKSMFRMRKYLIVCLLLLVWTGNPSGKNEAIGAFDISKVRDEAQNRNSDTLKETNEHTSPVEREHVFNTILRVSLYLVVVIGIIVIIGWLFRRNGYRSFKGGGGVMDIVEILPIGQGKMLFMVRVMDEVYLMTQTGTHIGVVDKIDGQKAIEILSNSKEGGSIIQFKDALHNFMGNIKKKSE